MKKRTPSREIDDLAAEWAAKVDGRALSHEEEAALEAWLKADARHLGAYAKARAVAVHTERARALGPQCDAEQVALSASQPLDISLPSRGVSFSRKREFRNVVEAWPPRFRGDDVPRRGVAAPSRRQMMLMGGAAASVALVAGVTFVLQRGQRIATGLGETRVVPLEDGSVVTLNTASEIEVRFTPQRRDIVLVQGEALFDVAKNRQRPFVVEAGDTQVRAVGTSFAVANLPGKPIQVLVREGVVEVKRPDVPVAPAVRVAANTRAIAPRNSAIAAMAIAPAEVNRALAWREGRLAFEGETLREVADTFARYSDTKIVIDDPTIANQTITGLFVSNDPIGFANAAALSLNLHAEIAGNEVRLTR